MAIFTRIFRLRVNHVRFRLNLSQIRSASLDSCLPRGGRLAVVRGAAADVTSYRVHAVRERTFIAHGEAAMPGFSDIKALSIRRRSVSHP